VKFVRGGECYTPAGSDGFKQEILVGHFPMLKAQGQLVSANMMCMSPVTKNRFRKASQKNIIDKCKSAT